MDWCGEGPRDEQRGKGGAGRKERGPSPLVARRLFNERALRPSSSEESAHAADDLSRAVKAGSRVESGGRKAFSKVRRNSDGRIRRDFFPDATDEVGSSETRRRGRDQYRKEAGDRAGVKGAEMGEGGWEGGRDGCTWLGSFVKTVFF
eukprot:78147-Pleurochrysis_carterae.AAC.1